MRGKSNRPCNLSNELENIFVQLEKIEMAEKPYQIRVDEWREREHEKCKGSLNSLCVAIATMSIDYRAVVAIQFTYNMYLWRQFKFISAQKWAFCICARRERSNTCTCSSTILSLSQSYVYERVPPTNVRTWYIYVKWWYYKAMAHRQWMLYIL